MSLNWKEIDRILEELDLPDTHIQEVVQPDFTSLVLTLYRPGNRFRLLTSFDGAHTRLNRTERRFTKPRTAQRFAQFLSSRVKGGRIVSAAQIDRDRIVRMKVVRGGETSVIWIRLWGNAGNMIVTDADGTILDAFYRRPKRNEVTGGRFPPEEKPKRTSARLEEFEVRPIPDGQSLNATIDAEYGEKHDERALENEKKRVRALLTARIARLDARLSAVESAPDTVDDAVRFREIGDLIAANAHTIGPRDEWLSAEDFYHDNAPVEIPIDPALSPGENAERYYAMYKKAAERSKTRGQDVANLRARRDQAQADLDSIESLSIDELRNRFPPRAMKLEAKAAETPGLKYDSNGYTILVGRTATENDTLLRRHVRGNDVWLHTRDYPGGYVFVKSKPGKSVPLEVLLDAGTLALVYSKARKSGRADLYYTFVKHLRRAKGAKLGTVLPTHEKNLVVTLDPARVRRLTGSADVDE
ncbi:MAG: fibronectin-binding domain-containing protein [Spirochaetaceae bacterium]|nr:MAG: fibronectin-binding domain-containing protein [Spirochaetaceae bacterium]